MRLYTQGNLDTPDDLAGNADLRLSNFLLTDDKDRPFSSIKRFTFNLDTINTLNSMYVLNQIVIVEPYILFEMFAKYTNLDKLMKESETSEAPVEAAPVEAAETEQ